VGTPAITFVEGWAQVFHVVVRAQIGAQFRFVALHALQLLPLLALGLCRTSTSSSQRVRLVLTSAASYTGLVGILFWQALRGQSLLSRAPSSFVALLSWFALSALFIWRSLAVAAQPGRAAITVTDTAES
jgi:hypothetical protein